MSITVEQVTKKYEKQKAINNISFQIQKGEVVGFLGPNGAGKSTMMKIITCYIPPSQGNVKVCNFSIHDDPMKVKKNIGYLPEHNPLYLDMYVKEYLNFIAKLRKINYRSKRVDEIIQIVGLEIEQKKKIEKLSKGYRQRVGIAQALIHNPEVLILDEPTTGLDPNQIVEIRELIKQIGKEKTIIMSTHIMQEVSAICNRAMIINKGNLIYDKSIDEIETAQFHTQSITVEFDQNFNIEIFKKTFINTSITLLKECKYSIQTSIDEKKMRADIFEFAVKNNLKVLEMKLEKQNIENIFQKLTVNN